MRFGRGNASQHVEISDREIDLTRNSTPLAGYTVDLHHAVQVQHNLKRLGEIVDAIETAAPRYVISNLICWWFTGCCFRYLVRTLRRPDYVRAYRYSSLWSRRQIDPRERYNFDQLHYSFNLLPLLPIGGWPYAAFGHPI